MNRSERNGTIIDLIFNLSRIVKSEMSFAAGNKHLTIHQLHILFYIAREKEVRMVDVAQNFNITKPTATVLINNLLRKGYVKRTVGKEDKREVKISMASKGSKLLDQANEYRSVKINHFLSYISEKDKQHLEKILKTIVERLKEEYES